MLKINDKNIYSKDLREMFKDYDEVTKDHKLNSEMHKCMVTCEEVVNVVDNLINAAIVCPDETVKNRIYLLLSIIGGMCSESLNKYLDDNRDDIDKLINTLEKVLDTLKED